MMINGFQFAKHFRGHFRGIVLIVPSVC